LWLKAAKQGHVQSQRNVELILKDGGNIDGAREWLTQVQAEKGNLDLHDGAKASLPSETEEALHAALEAYALWQIFRHKGETIKAKKWLREAARQGHAGAQYELGVIFRDEGKVDEAENWFSKAAEQGDADAQYNLGIRSYKKNNIVEAGGWFLKAAKQGHEYSKDNLAAILKAGVKINGAHEWLMQVEAEEGTTDVQYDLGLKLFQEGKIDEALEVQGHLNAQRDLDVISTKEDQVDETEARFLVSTVDEQRELDTLYPKAEAALKPFKKFCIAKGNKATMVHDSLSAIMDQCKKYGGKLLSHTEMLALKCNGKPDDHILVIEEAGAVTCGNYQKVYIDTPDGDYQINNDAFKPIIIGNDEL